jgi:hypothetical protein
MLPETSAHDDRQDATLEDISRVMLAIEPTIGLQQTGAANTQASEDVRPELSVAETVMEEIHSAHPLADWAVDPALAPAKPAAESAPMADWVVEDPAAPRPDSEPAWMILRRLEAELDEQMDAPAAAVPASRLKAEPRLFPAEAMAQLAQQLQPNSLLPPAELFRPSPHTIVPIAELETAMAAAEVKLLLPDDDAGQPEPIPPAVVTNAPAPASPDRMKRGANTVTNARAAVVDARPPRTPRAEADVDDFLFAPDQRPEARRRDPVTPKAGSEASVPPAERQWEGGTFPDPALVTPKTLPPVEAEAEQPKSDGSHDPLAPLRAMSDAEKIALFS